MSSFSARWDAKESKRDLSSIRAKWACATCKLYQSREQLDAEQERMYGQHLADKHGLKA